MHGNAKVLRVDEVGQVDSYDRSYLVTLYDDGEEKIEWMPLAC